MLVPHYSYAFNISRYFGGNSYSIKAHEFFGEQAMNNNLLSASCGRVGRCVSLVPLLEKHRQYLNFGWLMRTQMP